MQQLETAEGEQRMWIQSKVDNSFGNEQKRIGEINEEADKEKKAIEDDRKANKQERVEGTGLSFETGPAPDQGASANVNAFGVVPPDPPAPPNAPPKESEQAERGTFLQDLAGGAKGFVADAAMNLAAVGIALTTQVNALLETFDHAKALGELNQDRPAATRDASDIKPDAILTKPPAEEGDLADETGTYQHEEIEDTAEEAQQPSEHEIASRQAEPRVQTNVLGIELKEPPPPPPPPANDNEKSESKSR
jgi:hypothetical protein